MHDLLVEVSARQQLHNQVDALSVLKPFIDLDYVGVVQGFQQ